MSYLTVVIPTLNRSALLDRALASLLCQTLTQDHFEVIVVDNGSIDSTRSVCEAFASRFVSFRYIYDARPGLHIGRNLGLKHARGDILVYGDDDIVACPAWLEGVYEAFQDEDVALVGGKIEPDYESPPPEWVDRLWVKTPWGKALGQYSVLDFGEASIVISPRYVWGCNFSIRSETLRDCGGFHPDCMPQHLIRFQGDGETAVSDTIAALGKKTLYHPKVSVRHWVSSERMTTGYLYKRSYSQGVSDSYTRIRAAGGRTPEGEFGLWLLMIKAVAKFRVRQAISKPEPIQQVMRKGYLDGYLFHQAEAARDPGLVDWIVRKDYLED